MACRDALDQKNLKIIYPQKDIIIRAFWSGRLYTYSPLKWKTYIFQISTVSIFSQNMAWNEKKKKADPIKTMTINHYLGPLGPFFNFSSYFVHRQKSDKKTLWQKLKIKLNCYYLQNFFTFLGVYNF